MGNIRSGSFAVIGVAGLLALAACGSDGGSSSSSSGASGSASASIACASGSIKASGSSFQKNAINEWINQYQGACNGATIEYSPSGSSAGIQDFINNQTSFAGSDKAIADADATKAQTRCQNNPAWNLPMVGGAIAVAYNVPGVDKLTLTPEVTANIFSGKITNWNDPAIAAINPGVTLPNAPIAAYHRSDGSGTTANFTSWLTAASNGAWTYGNTKDWKAPGGQGAKGSDGVASSLKSTPNSISYIEASFVSQAGAKAAVINNGGGAVELTPETTTAGLATAKVTGEGNNLVLSLDYATKAPGAYPVLAVTYEITCSKGLGPNLELTKSFLTYTSSTAGQSGLTALDYAPLPADLQTKVAAAVAALSS